MIRALYDYEAQSSQELGFQKGDFFHVIGRENDADWYEACNPALENVRGLVPVAFFQILGKTERDSGQSEKSPQAIRQPDHDSGYSDNSGPATQAPADGPRMSKMNRSSGAMVYGVVMYDFAAERPDELDAKAGEAIIVIAQSNPEWFVAKPIGRLGGPGLIPVSFIEIRDMSSGQAVPNAQDAVQRAGVPKVEEWKKMAADYKNSSISLGKFENANAQQQQQLEQGMDRMSLQQAGRQSQSNGQNYVSIRKCREVTQLTVLAATAATTTAAAGQSISAGPARPATAASTACPASAASPAKGVRGEVSIATLCPNLGQDPSVLLCRRQVLVCY